MMALPRIIVHDHAGAYVGEIDPSRIIDARTVEVVNGEHSLTITTLQELEKTDRLLLRDGMGLWHEYVVLGITAEHTDGGAVSHEYYCVWSLQYDLSGTFVDDLYGCGYNPGRPSTPQPATRALECALEGTSRWTIGTVTQTTQSSASFYRRSGWEGMQTVIERWGGELSATIDVTTTGVVGRHVNLLAHVGSDEGVRRFDYGHDVTGIKRTVSDEVWPCRIVPLGKSDETEAGGYTRRKSIDSVNGGIPWVEDPSAVPLTRVPDGKSGWEYPTLIVKNETYSEPGDLKAWAVEHVSEYCRPIVSYEADVVQFEQAGMDPHGVALGDEVAIVDRTFCEGGLRIAARVVKVERSLLDPADIKLTIGNAKETLAGQLSGIAGEVAQLAEQSENSGEYQATAAYLSGLLSRLNNEANATGGYTYITEGNGLRTYDKAVTDPLVGAEATSVVEVKGGTIRIANSRTAAGDWDWKTVFTSGHIAAELVTAARIVSGYIGSADSGNYWNLDSGEFRMASTSVQVDGSTLEEYIDGSVDLTQTAVFNALTNNGSLQGLYMSGGQLYVNASYIKTGSLLAGLITSGKIQSKNGRVYFDLDNNELVCDKMVSTSSSNTITANIGATDISTGHGSTSRNNMLVSSSSDTSNGVCICPGSSSTPPLVTTGASLLNVGVGGSGLAATSDGYGVLYGRSSYPSTASVAKSTSSGYMAKIICHPHYKQSGATTTVDGTIDVVGYINAPSGTATFQSISVSGSKNRIADTEHYGRRLLSCYETPTPMFGDVGSGMVGGDGTCIVSIDDMLQETTRTDLSYQVFLQATGRGDVWVSEKAPGYFVVSGTPDTGFDWEVKSRQRGFDELRMESWDMQKVMPETGNEHQGLMEYLSDGELERIIYDIEQSQNY